MFGTVELRQMFGMVDRQMFGIEVVRHVRYRRTETDVWYCRYKTGV